MKIKSYVHNMVAEIKIKKSRNMDGFVKFINQNFDYLSHEIINNRILIQVHSNRSATICSYSGLRLLETISASSLSRKSVKSIPKKKK